MSDNQIISRQFITDALGDIEASVYDGYSGRGMYGGTCFGITFESRSGPFQFFALLGGLVAEQQEYDEPEVDSELAFDLARRASQDSMGMSSIVYFPGYELDGEPSDSDDY